MAYPVILIHGMSCTGANLKRVASLMTQRGYKCLAPTLPAHDASPDQPLQVGRQSLRDYLTFLEQIVATREDQRPPIIIGTFDGGPARAAARRTRAAAGLGVADAGRSLWHQRPFVDQHWRRAGLDEQRRVLAQGLQARLCARAALRLPRLADRSSSRSVRRHGSRIRTRDFRDLPVAARLFARCGGRCPKGSLSGLYRQLRRGLASWPCHR